MTAEPDARSGPGPLIRALGRAVNAAVARFPWSWRLFRGPVRRFSDSVAVGWDERVRSGSAEYLMALQAALDRLPAKPARILDIGTGTGAAALELADRYPDAEVVGIDISAKMVAQASARAADLSSRVRFLVADIASYEEEEGFDLIVLRQGSGPPQARRLRHQRLLLRCSDPVLHPTRVAGARLRAAGPAHDRRRAGWSGDLLPRQAGLARMGSNYS
jgi:SAM-dependent methyltransferase